MKRAIEESFPIVEINKLAVPERNAFKPIYQMHKWFARRSSSVFRAILLAAMKPAGTDIMKEFYKDHTNDPDTKGKVILDPFMGGGTTIVEALRLGCNVIGIDLNPVAWFIVKTETEPVDVEELKKAFERLSQRKVDWSGKTLKETLLELYKTECPCCGSDDSDIIYTFWVKSAPCTTALCNAFTPLFKDYVVAKKSPSIRYFPDTVCPECKGKFDWEREPANMCGNNKLMVNANRFSAGEGRTNARWAYSEDDHVNCPWCEKDVLPRPGKSKLKRKKVLLTILNCPHCEEVWQFRGELPETVECPTCKHSYNPNEGTIPDKGKFVCEGSCGGNKDSIINAIKKHPANELLPVKAYAVEGYCKKCSKMKPQEAQYSEQVNESLFDYGEIDSSEEETLQVAEEDMQYNPDSTLWKNNGKFFKRVSPKDAAKYRSASDKWAKVKKNLTYPKSEIPIGEKTKSGLLAHHYKYWHQMFNDRQLLGLSTLLRAIREEEDQVMMEMMLLAFSNSLNDNNMFCRFAQPRNHLVGVFARHDYQPKSDPLEGNIFGTRYGHGGFSGYWDSIINGKEYLNNLSKSDLKCISSTSINVDSGQVDFVITDPPYGGNVNYSELSDFFYVWLRTHLREIYPHFAPEITPKAEEIVENRTRGLTSEDFKEGLKSVFDESNRLLKNEGVLAFTFHHSEGETWESLLEAICQAGFYLEAVYPIHGEAENSLHLMDKDAISYDLIHVCKKIDAGQNTVKRPWANIRSDIRRQAREEVKVIEKGRYGKGLSAPDVNLILIGKCLELYSRHYGKIVDHEDKPVPLGRALEEIKVMVDQLTKKESPLPAELEDIDIPSYVYFTSLVDFKEVNSDSVSKNTRGLIETSKLRELGLIIKGREKRGRTFEVKQPADRFNELKSRFLHDGQLMQNELFENGGNNANSKFLFVDYMHLLLGAAETGESLYPWLERFEGKRPLIRAACQYFISKNKFEKGAKTILGLIDEQTLFTKEDKK
jgi:adenine-specific DNA methylase